MKNTITYNWWNNELPKESIPENAQMELEQSAMSRIAEMVKETYISGELLEEIDGVSYRGYWELSNESTTR